MAKLQSVGASGISVGIERKPKLRLQPNVVPARINRSSFFQFLNALLICFRMTLISAFTPYLTLHNQTAPKNF